MDRPIRIDASAVPKIAFVVRQRFSLTGHQDAIGDLALTALIGRENPIKPRESSVNTQRIRAMFTSQMRGKTRGL